MAWFDAGRFADQARHVMPLGFASSLFGLRAQADQWVAAALFSLASFSAFSIAAVVGPIVNVFRHSVMEAFLQQKISEKSDFAASTAHLASLFS